MNKNKIIALLPDMAIFAEVVEHGSYTAAAKALGSTPSAVSRQMTRLEAELGVRLLQRTTRRQSLTPEGSEAYARCRELLDCAKDVGQIGAQTPEAKGLITVAAPKAYSKRVLEPLVLEFLASHPYVSIHFKVTDTLLNPAKDNVDIAFRLSEQLIDGLVSKRLHTIHSFLCASEGYLAEHGTPEHPSDLSEHSCIALGEHLNDNQWLFVQDDQEIQISTTGRYRVNHSEMRMNGVKAGLGIGLFPDFTAREALKYNEVVRVLADWEIKHKYQGEVSMQFAQNKYMPTRLRLFIDFIEKKLRS